VEGCIAAIGAPTPASGKTIRMYRAGSTRLVVLPPKGDGAAVLLETREPEKFAVEVREKWLPARPAR